MSDSMPAMPDNVKTIFSMPISNAPGKTVTSLIVDYAPGEKAPPHHHGSAFVVGYVLSGELRSQWEGEPMRIYKAGEYFIEEPGSHHLIAENSSKDQDLKLLVVFVHDSADPNIVVYD